MALEQISSTRGVVAQISNGLLASPGLSRRHHAQSSRQAEDARTEAQPRNPRPHIVSQRLFTSVLVRERKRADRADQPLVLMLVRLRDGVTAHASSVMAQTIAALAATSRETDILGWLEVDTVIGVILTEVHTSDPVAIHAIEARIHRDLVKHLGAAALAGLSIRLNVHPDPKGTDRQDVAGVDPLLHQIHTGQNRAPRRDPLKRALDIVGSLALLAVLSPVLLVIAVLVKLKSPGPIFFRQARIGQMMRPFMLLKFRTMHVNADHGIHHEFVTQFIKSKPAQAADAGKDAFFKIADDPRVTPVGRVLRRTSLDELPQLWNVLRGDMSLVGPRPPLQYEVDQYKSWHRRRVVEAKPGLTGLWQVTGRSRTTFDEMVRLDLRYARMCSLRTDIKILLATPAAVFTGKGAC